MFDTYRRSTVNIEAEDLKIIEAAKRELASFKKALRELSDLEKLQEPPDND